MESNNKFLSIITILILVIMFLGALVLNSNHNVKDIKKDIVKLEKKQSDRAKYNDGIDKKQSSINERIGNGAVMKAAKNFNDKFYTWSSWNEFSDNMKDLRATYPNLQDSNIVDISGKSVGNGDSPDSIYSTDFYATDKKGQVAELITQNKSTETSGTKLQWFKIENMEKGKYSITYLKPYNEANLTSEE
ncbi:hypothetical protein [Staphylococcus succinus]|uniref:hypothetical protein n=1 Tax=Staphylococcus succinus TaxID=61015 RepID=UPI000E692DC3|nr:hypothetical protein [Staphylococcus succinus]RIN27710.1 hypothetical protein BU067_01505 [Staphylococcus succinus]